MNLRIIFFICIISTLGLRGQRASQNYRFTTEITQYAFGNIPISLEKFFGKRATIGIDLGIRIATKQSGVFQNKEMFPFTGSSAYDYTIQNTFNRFYNAYTLGIHFKYYLSDSRRFYLEPAFYYRYWWFNEKEVEFTRESNGDFRGFGFFFNGIRTENQKDYVFSLNLGRTIKFKQNRKRNYVLDFEMGIGMIDRSYEFFTLRGTVQEDPVRNFNERGFGKHPYLNLGLSIGFEQ